LWKDVSFDDELVMSNEDDDNKSNDPLASRDSDEKVKTDENSDEKSTEVTTLAITENSTNDEIKNEELPQYETAIDDENVPLSEKIKNKTATAQK
jgi:hypothetical protein